MSHIFLSYSSKDKVKTKKLATIFEKQGWKVWWDKNIPPGAAFDRAIGKALDQANCIVVLWSPNSVKSSWVLEETYEGRERGILVPALIETTRLPFGYRTIQYVDLSKWKGSSKDAVLQKLLEQVAAMQPIPLPAKSTSKKKATSPKLSRKAKPKSVKAMPASFKRKLSGALDGKTIVFTGTLSESRNAHAEKVDTVGARFVNTISSKTDYLVVGEKPGEKKLTDARKHDVKEITEEQWHKILNKAYRRTLLGKNIVFTGKLSESRTVQEERAEALGAIVQRNISGKTDYLIVGEKAGQVKLDRAVELGVELIAEKVWQEIVGSLG